MKKFRLWTNRHHLAASTTTQNLFFAKPLKV